MESEKDQIVRACLPIAEQELVLSTELPVGQCFLVIDRKILDRCWGGFRVVENLTLGEVRVLARTMTIKSILAGIPVGGAKGGLSLAVQNYDREELLRMICRTVAPVLRQHGYFLGTDLGFTEADANFVYACAGIKRRSYTGRITAGEACALGILTCLEYVGRKGIHPFAERTVAIEGFGNMGVPTAQQLSSRGYRIVAISDVTGALYDPNGLDIQHLLLLGEKGSKNVLSRYRRSHIDSDLLPKESINHIGSEVLIPGARSFTIDEYVAGKIRAKVICPISNAPVTRSGEETLAKRKIVSIPDVISNAGAVIGNFAQHLGANEAETKSIVSDIITQNLDLVFSDRANGQPPKKVASTIAVERLEEIDKSERITSIKFLLPWIRRLGLKAVAHGAKEYANLKMSG